MAIIRDFVYFPVMQVGQSELSLQDKILQQVTVRILYSHMETLTHKWHLDLFSPFWRLYVHKRSGAHLKLDQNILPLRPDYLYLIPAWLHFQTGTSGELIQYYMHFELSGFSPSLQRKAFHGVYAFPIEDELQGPCENWIRELDRPQQRWSHLAHAYALAYTAMACIIEQAQEKQNILTWLEIPRELRPALDRMNRQLDQPPDNRELARLCGWSTDHFIKRFREYTGTTPALYNLERRLELATQRLIHTPDNIDSIADSLGFSDRFHFTKAFKRHLNQTPAAYRKAHISR